MKESRFIIAITLLTVVIGFNNHLLSWGLFDLFNDDKSRGNSLKNLKSFDPNTDIQYLPRLEGKDFFESINDLSICRKKDVRKYIYVYLTSGREYVKRAIKRSYIYYDIIEEIFKKNDTIPIDISLLPLLESGFNPLAVSKNKAVGLWQFMRNTSRPLGLKRNRWVDERRDIEKSTEAAISHLNHLYKKFNSWELALAAYNGGAGHVGNALKKTGSADIWELRESGALHNETNEFIPKFIALLVIYKNQELFDIKDEIRRPDIPKTENIELQYPVDIKYVSRLSGAPIKIIKKFNPELNHHYTPPHNKNYTLRLPVEAKKKLLKNKNRLYRSRYTYTKKYTIKKGDCISVIAGNHKKKLVPLYDLTV